MQFVKMSTILVMVLVLLSGLIAAGCAKPAPAPTPAPKEEVIRAGDSRAYIALERLTTTNAGRSVTTYGLHPTTLQSVGGLCQGRPGRTDWSWGPSRCSPGYNRASGIPPTN